MIGQSKFYFRNLQECLIRIHKMLIEIVKNEFGNKEFDLPPDQRNYGDKLLQYLVMELKKYGLYTKYEKLPYNLRRKELLTLLTKQLGIRIKESFSYGGAGDDTLKYGENMYNFPIKLNYIPDGDFEPVICDVKCNLASGYTLYKLYNNILNEIHQELNGIAVIKKNSVVHRLLLELCSRLQQQGQFMQFEKLNLKQRRRQLLSILAAELLEKRDQIYKNNLIQKGETGNNGFSLILNGKYDKCPTEMWEKIINIGPRQDYMVPLYNYYPTFVIEMFLELLAEEKESIILEEDEKYRKKIRLLKKEALKKIESLRNQVNREKFVDTLLDQYAEQLKCHYDFAENEFYWHNDLKMQIRKVTEQIEENRKLANRNLMEIKQIIISREEQFYSLQNTLCHVKRMVQQKMKISITSSSDFSSVLF